MDKWLRKIFGLILMGIAFMLLAGQAMLVMDGGFANREGGKLLGFVFGAIIFVGAGVLLLLLGFRIFRKKDKAATSDVLDELE